MKTIYMSVDGNDANDGGALSPVRTFARVDELVEPGDVIMMRGGDVYESTVRYDSDNDLVVEDMSISTYTSDDVMVRAGRKYAGCVFCHDDTNSLLDTKPVVSASVVIPGEAITVVDGVRTFRLQHRHNKHAAPDGTGSIQSNSLGRVWVDGMALTLASSLDNCKSTMDTYYVVNEVEPVYDRAGLTTQRGVCRYYLNVGDFTKVEAAFFGLAFEATDRQYGDSVGITLRHVAIRRAANKDSNHLHKGVCDDVTFEDGANHNVLKNSTRLTDCVSKGAMYCLYHGFTGGNVTELVYDRCRAEGTGHKPIGFYSHAASNNVTQRITLRDCRASNVSEAMKFSDAKSAYVEGLVSHHQTKLLTTGNYDDTDFVLRDCKAYAFNDEYNGRSLDVKGRISLRNCAMTAGECFLPGDRTRSYVEYDGCTVMFTNKYFSNNNKVPIRYKDSLLIGYPIVNGGVKNLKLAYSTFEGCYLHNLVLEDEGGTTHLPTELGLMGNLRIERNVPLFEFPCYTLKDHGSIYKHGVIDGNVVWNKRGRYIKIAFSVSRSLIEVSEVPFALTMSNGTETCTKKYNTKNGFTLKSGTLDFFKANVMDLERGIIMMDLDTYVFNNHTGDPYQVTMDIVYDDHPQSPLLVDPNICGDFRQAEDIACLGVGYSE